MPLLPYESCYLGSLNLARFITAGGVDLGRLRAGIHLAVRFLDDVIEVSRYPVPELAGPARAARKVGLGLMGLAEMLATLGIPYDSPDAVRLAGRAAPSRPRDLYPVIAGRTGGVPRCLLAGQGASLPGRRRRGWRRLAPR